MNKVLLLGSTGKLGKHVLKELLFKDYEIGLLLRNIKNYDNQYNLKLFQGDITLKNTLEASIEWADVIINCSGYVSYKRNDTKKLYSTNVDGVKNIVDLCSKFDKKLIHTSSVIVYGSTKQPIACKENIYLKESYKSAYSNSKIEAEKLVLESNISYLILRPSTLISDEKSTLKTLYGFYKKGIILNFKGGASFALMEDAAKAYVTALELLFKSTSIKEVINIGGNNLSIKEVFDTFKVIENKSTRTVPNGLIYMFSIFNDFILYPYFKRSLITYENYQIGNRFSFVDSSKAATILDYKITPFIFSLKTIL